MARILSLGGSGFIGSYVVRRLLKDGHSVTVADNFSKYGFLEHDFYTPARCTRPYSEGMTSSFASPL
jgi:nucleoside-diphosphate-sugar epimerase